ncbi:IS1096 element passenger TnpR family protein [Actinocorallia lasiicapitis]
MEKYAELLGRLGDLKVALGDFAMGPRFRKELQAYVSERLDGFEDESQVNTLIDTFVLQVPVKGGGTVVERFAATHPGLTGEERELLRSWTDPVQGVFEIVERTGDGGVVGRNLFNELTYVIRSNMGAAGLAALDPGVLFAGRLAPVLDDWMITGPALVYRTPVEKAQIRARLPELVLAHPREVFRNPEKLAAGREMQAEQRRAFLDLYGDDVLIVPAGEAPVRAAAVYRRVQEWHGVADASVPPMPFPEEWDAADSVALIFDEVDGLGFYLHYAKAQRAFADPALIAKREFRDVVTAYLRDEPSPVPISRLVRDAAPADVDKVFQKLLNKPGFGWDRDGEQLLRRHKASWYDDPPLPRTVPAPAVEAPRPTARPKPKPGPSPLRAVNETAASAPLIGRLVAFTGWLGAGRKLTQKGHLTLKDARELVALLTTADTIDPVIGDKVWKTQSSDDLWGLRKVVGVAKAVRLARVTGGRLVPVKKNAALLDQPGELLGTILTALPGLAPALFPDRWESLTGEEFDRVAPAVLSRLYRANAPVPLSDLKDLAWTVATTAYWLDDIPDVKLGTLRSFGDRDVRILAETLHDLGLTAAADPITLSDLGRYVLARHFGAPLPGDPVHQLKITLDGSADPQIWRRVLVPATAPLTRLHTIIQDAMGWEFSHLHAFTAADGTTYTEPGMHDLPFLDETGVNLSALGRRFTYEYDFGDGWTHTIEVEATLPADESTAYPLCTAGAGACPPEDCGGIPGYFHLREALADPHHPEHAHYLEWLDLYSPTDLDPAAFDPTEANNRLG